jgi:hypothetical protein
MKVHSYLSNNTHVKASFSLRYKNVPTETKKLARTVYFISSDPEPNSVHPRWSHPDPTQNGPDQPILTADSPIDYLCGRIKYEGEVADIEISRDVAALLLSHPPVQVGQLQVADLMQVGDVEGLIAHRVAVLRVDASQKGEKHQEDGKSVKVIAGHVVHAQHLQKGKDGRLVGGHQVAQPHRAHGSDPLLDNLIQEAKIARRSTKATINASPVPIITNSLLFFDLLLFVSSLSVTVHQTFFFHYTVPQKPLQEQTLMMKF